MAVVSTEALKHNYGELKKLLQGPVKMMAVVKANAYGHGDVEVSRVLETLGCEYLGVAIAEEGVRLRKCGIACPIVVLGGAYPEQVDDLVRHDLTPVVFDIDSARIIDRAASSAGVVRKVHVKIDSGMGRLGLLPAEVPGFFKEFRALRNVSLEGVLSHLSEAEAPDKSFSLQQLRIFLESVDVIRSLGLDPGILGIANSAGAVEVPETRLNLVRPGIMLYGSYPSPRLKEIIRLKPVMEVKTRILKVKRLPEGSPVSYGRTFVTKRDSLIAVLPIGYGDGLTRRLSGAGEVLIRGRRAPIVGVVCMDFTMVDVTDIEGVEAGDEAIVLGVQGDETITAEDIAEMTDTIPYEIFCNISPRVPRVYI